MLLCIWTNTFPPLHLHTWVRAPGPQQLTFSNTVCPHTLTLSQVEVTYSSLSVRPLVCPQSATNIHTVGSNNDSVVSSPWLSPAAQPTARRMGHRNRRFGALRYGICISNPSNLEVGEVDTAGFQSSTPRPAGREYMWLLRPLALPF